MYYEWRSAKHDQLHGERSRRLWLTPLLICSMTAAPLSGQRVVGTVEDADSDISIADALIVMIASNGDTAAVVSTNQDGRFVLDAPRQDSYSLYVHRQGYADTTVVVSVGARQRVSIRVALRLSPSQLETLDVVASSSPWWQQQRPWWEWEFWERREYYSKLSLGRFLTEEQLAQFADVSTMLRLFIRKRPPPLDRRSNSDCSVLPDPRREGLDGWAMYWDGKRWWPPLPSFAPGDLIGVEIYQGAAQLPAELTGVAAPCGVIAYWPRK